MPLLFHSRYHWNTECDRSVGESDAGIYLRAAAIKERIPMDIKADNCGGCLFSESSSRQLKESQPSLANIRHCLLPLEKVQYN